MKRTRLVLLLLAALHAPAAQAAESEVEALRARLEALERQQQQTLAQLDQLRARLDGEPEITAAAPDEDVDLEILAQDDEVSRPVDFHGYLSYAYFGFEEVSIAPTESGALSDLNPQSSFATTDLSFFVGIPISDALYVATEIEYELGGDEIDVDQAFIQWDLRKEEPLSLRMGKFYVPFGIERFYQNAPQNLLVDRPSPYVHIIPGTYSETGFELLGKKRLADGPEIIGEYEIALANGLGAVLWDSARQARQNRDNNSSKAFGGRLGLAIDRWLKLGVSAQYAEYDDEDDDGYTLLGTDLRAAWGGFFLRGEYVYAKIDGGPDSLDADGMSCADLLRPDCGNFHRRGWYLEGSYRHRPFYLPPLRLAEYVVRFDDLDEDDRVRDLLDAHRLAVGLVLHPLEHFRLKFQYEFIDEQTDEFDNNAFLFEASVNW